MKRFFTALLVLLFLAYQAYAQTTFNATASARWQLPCTSSSAAYNPDAQSACRLSPDTQAATWLKSDVTISWGTGQVPGYTSTLIFSSYSNVPLTTAYPGVAIGKLTHLNYPINCFNNCSKYIPTNFVLDMLFNVSLAGGSVFATFNGVYNMVLDETPNVDGRVPFPSGTCPYNPNEISWVTNIGGYSTAYPCCPYYTQNAAPGPLGAQFPLNGPCSDRLVFPNGVSRSSPFTLGGTQYTVVISGFAKTPTAFDTRINYFTSQENQQQEAYIYAYVVRACSSNTGCDDGKTCTTDVCDTVNGVCVNTPKAANTLCTDPVNTPYDSSNTCLKYKCSVSGTCLGSATNTGLTCPNPTPSTRPSGSTPDCTYPICNTGACVWAQANSGSCTQPTTSVTDGQCQRRSCVLGTCRVLSTNEGFTCLANNANQRTAISKYPECNSAKCTSGSCRYTKATGSCITVPVAACNRRLCRTISIGGVSVGSCLGSYVAGSCTALTAKECNRRICVSQTGAIGSCSYQTSTGSCTGVGAQQQCRTRTCVSGTCKSQPNPAQGSCTVMAIKACYARLCNTQGTCIQGTANNGGSCQFVGTPVDCKRRICQSGSCTSQTSLTQGSCKNSGLVGRQCKARNCNSGTCGYMDFNTGGSCTDLTAVDCKRRTCASGTCKSSTSTTQGSCVNSGLVGRQCKARNCNSGTCGYMDFNTGGSCTDLTAVDCKRRTCASGTCKASTSTTQGSCRNSGLVGRQCKARNCNAGTCGYMDFNTGGSCTDLTAVDCKRRTCTSGTCKSSVSTTQGSCRNSGVAAVACYKRTCVGSVCTPSTQDGGSCVGPTIKACYKRTCNAGTCQSGLDTVLTTGGGSCTWGTAYKECYKRTCTTAGACVYGVSNGGSCTAKTLVSCSRRICAAGTCGYVATTGSCASWLTQRQCRSRICSGAGNCIYQAANTGGSCTDLTTRVECKRRLCTTNLGGTCEYQASTTQGSCTSFAATACYKRLCNGLGTCKSNLDTTLTNNGGSCTWGTAFKPCYKRTCSTGGVCQYSTQDSGSCTSQPGGTAVPWKSCWRRICQGGVCTYVTNSLQGSCTIQNDGTAVSWRSCQRRTCNTQGTCVYSPNSAQGSCTTQPGGAAVAVTSCMRRICDTTGSCSYSFYTAAAGSCTSGASGAAAAVQECNKRTCNTVGSCVYLSNTVQGSCTGATVKECSIRQCATVTGGAYPATCSYTTLSTGSCVGTAISECRRRTCQSGVCRTVVNTAQGSCTSISPTACNKRKCDTTGACVGSWNGQTGSCVNANAQECYARRCANKSGVGSCSYTVQNGGSCVGTWASSLVVARSLCSARSCNAGTCRFNYVAGTCNSGKTTNDRTCFTQRCRSVAAGGGTCSTSARVAQTCTAIPSRPCASRACDASGYCSQVTTGFPSGTPCTDASKGPTNNFCSPQRCDGLGSCVNRPDIQNGVSCLTPPDSAAALCITSQCENGVCKDYSDLSKNGTFKCKANQPNEDTCSTYFCLFRSGSQTNHLGTCVRQVDSSTVGLSCIIPNNPDSTIDQRCYKMVCSSNGQCIKQPAAPGTYCATPSNTVITNGYGCSQYECLAGTCNTGVAKPITNGSNCAGSIPCDPSQPGCLSECQRFVCFNGICTIDYFKENQNCTYIKYLTARDGSLVEVRANSEGGNNECTTGKCYQGRCTAVTAQNGTACGNRTKLGDLCYNDYCDSTGACVHSGRRNCAGVLPLPSVCWDVTCEASTGDCVLVANGVVDCSCINDCSACTASFSNTNSTGARTLGCWWCTGKNGQSPGCFNRYLPGSTKEIPAPKDNGPCYSNSAPCGGGGGITGGQIAGIVVGILGLSSLAALLLALGALLFRYFTAAGTPPANASLTDLAFNKNVKNNVFYEGANLEKFSAVYAEPRFITS